MKTPEEEFKALQVMRSRYSDLDRWQARQGQVETPQAGSELAIDDAVFPMAPISQTVRISLVMALDHLLMLRTVLEAAVLYASAPYTLMRGALVGASQAVWILESDDPAVRQDRGLTVWAEVLSYLDKHYELEATMPLASQAADAELADQRKWLAERRAEVAQARQPSRSTLQQTRMIKEALEATFSDDERRHQGQVIWQRMSADAHVLGWSMFQRSEMGRADKRTGLSTGQAGGSIADMMNSWSCVFFLLQKGWSLFDRRCEA